MRKRGPRSENEDMTVERRMRLKKSVEDGDLVPYDIHSKRSLSLNDLVEDGGEYLTERTTLLGNGVYGRVHLLKSQTGETVGVAKIVVCCSNLLGNPRDDPFRSEHVEPRMLPLLWNDFVVQHRATPHLVAPLGQPRMVDWVTKEHKQEDDQAHTSLVHFMEYANNLDLRNYLEPLYRTEFNLHIRVILFQICYTLATIHLRYPNFKHNDLKDDNICMHTTERGGYYKYSFQGTDYYVPRIGSIPVIGDFDFACIPGQLLDNYKTLEQEWLTPTYAISTKKDRGSDLYSLVSYLRHHFPSKFENRVQRELEKWFGSMRGTANILRAMPGDMYPLVDDFLCRSNLFDDFKVCQATVVDEFSTRGITPNLSVSIHLNPKQVKRFCPILRSVDWHDSIKHLPSYQFWSQTEPDDPAIDAELPCAYIESEGERILEKMRLIYDETPYFGFDPKSKDTFFDFVLEKAETFLENYRVPVRWWPAAFTCAWMDTATDMNLYQPGQASWGTEQWTLWWRMHGNVRYTEMQLLHFFLQWSWPASQL